MEIAFSNTLKCGFLVYTDINQISSEIEDLRLALTDGMRSKSSFENNGIKVSSLWIFAKTLIGTQWILLKS